MTALLITLAAWFVVAPLLALLVGAIVHRRDDQVPGRADPVGSAAPVRDTGTQVRRSSAAA